MKNISILNVLLFFSTLLSFSQEIVPLEEQYNYEHEGNPYYLKDVNYLLDKFTGEWEFTDPTHYLKIKLYKIEGVNESSYPKETFDEIRSFILYKEKQGNNWIIIYNTYPVNYTIADLNNQNFNNDLGINGNLIYNDNNVLSLNYYEPAPTCTDQRHCSVKLTYLNNANNFQLQWRIGNCYTNITTDPCNNDTTINPFQNHKIPHLLTLNKL